MVVVLVSLAAMALAHGMLLSARTELAASWAGARQLELRAASAGALALTLAAAPADWMDSVALWEARPVVSARFGRADAVGALRRVAREAWLAEASARVPAGAGSGTGAPTSALVWVMDPVMRVADLGGVLQVDTGRVVTAAGPVDGVGFTRVEPPLTGAACARWSALIDSFVPPFMPPVARRAVPADGPRLGLLTFDSLLARAGVTVLGSGAPGPVERLGACDVAAPWNWGDPDGPTGPCGGHLALRRARGDLRVEGGAGQGILIVDGDVTFADGARFYGLVVGRGVLRLEGSAQLTGAALAAGGAVVSAAASVHGSACWVTRALAAHRATIGSMVLLEGPEVGPM